MCYCDLSRISRHWITLRLHAFVSQQSIQSKDAETLEAYEYNCLLCNSYYDDLLANNAVIRPIYCIVCNDTNHIIRTHDNRFRSSSLLLCRLCRSFRWVVFMVGLYHGTRTSICFVQTLLLCFEPLSDLLGRLDP